MTVAKGLEAAASIAGESAEGDSANKLGGVSAVDVSRVRLGEGDGGGEEGIVEGKDG